MVIWFALLIPFLFVAMLIGFFRHKVVWWEIVVPVAVSAFLIFIFKISVEAAMTSATEYINGNVVKATYYEDWNEEVPCSHPVYCTDKDNKRYECGKEHMYDVDYHPEYWEVIDDNKRSYRASKQDFHRLSQKFGNLNFVDMRRDYHTNDGDAYVTKWDGSEEKHELTVRKHTYTNKVQASKSVFKFLEVDDSTKKDYGIFDYPQLRGYHMKSILGTGDSTQSKAEKRLNYFNGMLGKKKQVRMFICIYESSDLETGMVQESYWYGGNKNEFILTIGVDKDKAVKWCYPISWTNNDLLKIEVRDYVLSQEKLNLIDVVNYMGKEVDKNFVRREFAEFNYLTVEPPTWAIITTFIVTLLVNIGISFWLITNEFE